MTAPISYVAAHTAIKAANTASKQATATLITGETITGTARWVTSDLNRLAFFGVTEPEGPSCVYLDVARIASITTAATNADTTLNLIPTDTAGVYQPDPGWAYGTGLE